MEVYHSVSETIPSVIFYDLKICNLNRTITAYFSIGLTFILRTLLKVSGDIYKSNIGKNVVFRRYGYKVYRRRVNFMFLNVVNANRKSEFKKLSMENGRNSKIECLKSVF